MSIKVVSKPLTADSVTIQLPGSKSESNRLMVLAALSGFDGTIEGVSDARDTRTLNALLQKVMSGSQQTIELDCLDGGAPLRFLMAVAALIPGHYLLTGTPRLMERPQTDLIHCLRNIGVPIVSLGEESDKGPWKIQGGCINQSQWKISASTSSQFASALFLIAPFMGKRITIELEGDVVSEPYINLTLNALKRFGVQFNKLTPHVFEVLPGSQVPEPLSVEADWSAAPYFLAAAELKGMNEIIFPRLNFPSSQGDAFIKTVFQYEGWQAEEIRHARGLIFRKSPRLWNRNDLTINLISYPDLAPPLITYFLMQNRGVRFYGLETLSGKESVRDAVLGGMVKQCGGVWKSENKVWELLAGKQSPPKILETHSDHRMVMSFALLSIIFGEISLSEKESVDKSFPNFWKEIAKIGIY